ncbi:ribosome maturation factor RimP [Clostridium paraputrificum]|uniref:ribosome maturation factor RimP n=1 Tax=Clostridium TaxID=1485 RepID=UPI003D33469E
MQNNALNEKVAGLVKPIADELNYELYHVEFVKEDGENYLRIYIDKPEGISLTDCEALSRRVSTMLDEEDPIPDSYYLEVSSPGLNRGLYKDEHFSRYIGRDVEVKLNKAINGSKSIKGILKKVTEDSISIEADEEVTVPKLNIKSANLDGEI